MTKLDTVMQNINSIGPCQRVGCPVVSDPEREAGEKRWNDAVDWLLNSRHCADPYIQTPFWQHVDGEITLDELRAT